MSKQYILHVCIGDDEQLVDIGDKLIFGSSPESDVNLEAPNINPKHLIFRVSNGVLTVRNNSLDNNTKLGETALKPKKMVILDTGDVITIGDLQLKISAESDEEDATSADDLPTATTLFKLAKAEFDAEESEGEEEKDDENETLDDLVDSEERTGEYDVDELFDPAPEQPKRRWTTLFNLFKRNNKTDEDIEDEISEDDIAEDDESVAKTSWIKQLFKRKNTTEQLKETTGDPRVRTIEEGQDTDEEEEEVQEHDPAQRSFIQKIIYKLKFKKRGIAAPTVKAIKEKIPPMSFISRLYALVFSYTLAYTLYSYFTKQINNYLHYPELLKLLNHPEITKILTLIKPYWHKLPAEMIFYIEKIYPIFLIVIMLDILGAIIFAAPFPLVLLGVHTSGNIILKRVQALIKAILGIFHPILIFDLPLIISIPSLKELLTASRYEAPQRKLLSTLGHLLLLPFILILLVSPFIIELIPPNKLPTQLITQTLTTPSGDKNSSYRSSLFKFKANAVSDKIISIPQNFDNQRQHFTISTILNNQQLVIHFQPVGEIAKLHNYLVLHNPLYQLYTSQNGDNIEQELTTIFQLDLTPNKIINFLKQFGPLLFPIYKYKQRLLDILHIERLETVQVLQGTSNFLKFTQGNQVHLLTLSSPYLHIYYQAMSNNQSIANQLPQLMLSKLTPLRAQHHQKATVISFDNKLDPFTYLDMATSNKIDATKSFYNLYLGTLQQIITQNSKVDQNLLQQKINTFKKLHTQLCPTCLTPKKALIQKPQETKRPKKQSKSKRVKYRKKKKHNRKRRK